MLMSCPVHCSINWFHLLPCLSKLKRQEETPVHLLQIGHVHINWVLWCVTHECVWTAFLKMKFNIATMKKHLILTDRNNNFVSFQILICLSPHFHNACLINVTWLTVTCISIQNYLKIKVAMSYAMQWEKNVRRARLVWNWPIWSHLTHICMEVTLTFLTPAHSAYLLSLILKKWMGK